MLRFSKTGIRIFGLALILCCLFCHTGFAFAQQDTEQTVLTSIVRNGASHNSANIGRLENGTIVTVLGEYGDFYKIDCYDMVGFIAKSQVVHKSEENKYYVNCKTDSPETLVLTYVEQEEVLHLRHEILKLAKQQLGTPYVFGGTRPGGFDCSGLMLYLYGSQDFSLHRGSSGQIMDGIVVAKENMQIGDLVFFKVPGETYTTSHVGMYAGNNQIIHAGNQGVAYADLRDGWYSDYFLCARRIINTPPTETGIGETATGLPILPGISGRTVQ